MGTLAPASKHVPVGGDDVTGGGGLPEAGELPAWPVAGAGPDGSTRRQIAHDIRHEVGTIMMLASLLSAAPDVGQDSQDRARQLLGETRWLDQLLRAYEAAGHDADPGPGPAPREHRSDAVRLDTVVAEVVTAMRLSTLTQVKLTAVETWAHADRLACWRALRNLVGNAVRAAGRQGVVSVGVTAEDGWAVAQIDDDGPGFGSGPPGLGSLGLGIVQDFVATWGGHLEIRRGVLGGCCVRLHLPAAPPGPPAARTLPCGS